MIIFGTTTLNSTVDSGTFSCPRCNSQQPHRVVGVNRWFTLFFVPVLPLGRKGVYVECQSCAGTYSTDVLETVIQAEMVSAPQMPTTTMDSTVVQGAHSSERVYATTSAMAVASMILSLVAPCLCYLGAIPAIVSVILGYLAVGRIKASAGKLQGRGFAYVGMVIGCCWIVFTAVMVAAVLLSDPSEKESDDLASTPPDTSAAVLLDAESRIRTDRDGVAHGNTDHARELAAQFANDMSAVRDEFFTEGAGGISLSGGKFLTYCHVSPDKCAFLVHVPQYRKFTDDAKHSLASLAWTVSQNIVREELGESTEIALGLKGVVLYGSVMIGDATLEQPSYAGTDSERLHPFFTTVRQTLDANSDPESEPTIDTLQTDIPLDPSTDEPAPLGSGFPANAVETP